MSQPATSQSRDSVDPNLVASVGYGAASTATSQVNYMQARAAAEERATDGSHETEQPVDLDLLESAIAELRSLRAYTHRLEESLRDIQRGNTTGGIEGPFAIVARVALEG